MYIPISRQSDPTEIFFIKIIGKKKYNFLSGQLYYCATFFRPCSSKLFDQYLQFCPFLSKNIETTVIDRAQDKMFFSNLKLFK